MGLDTDAYSPPPHLKSRIVKDMAFSSSPVWMWELDDKKGWAPKNWCLWSMVMQKTLDSLLDSKEIQPVHPKWNQSWIFIGRTDGEAKASVLWPPDVKNWLTGKDADAEKDWRQEEKGMTEEKMVGWHHRLEGHEFEQAPGVGDGQGSLEVHRVTKSWTWLSKWTTPPGDTIHQPFGAWSQSWKKRCSVKRKLYVYLS